jgi:hypothetical protein
MPTAARARWSQIDRLFDYSIVGRRGDLEQVTSTREKSPISTAIMPL